LFIAYQIILVIALIIASPYLLLRAIIGGHGLKERLGLWDFQPDGRQVVWFHAASMGELKIISTILPEFQKLAPDIRVIITTVTKTGRAKASKLPFPVETFYLPVDIQFAVKKVVKKIQPILLVLAETELWPALIDRVNKAGAKITIVNGRISDRSFKLYQLVWSITLSMLKKIDYIMTQTDSDAERFMMLGARPSAVAVYGNTKFDQVLTAERKPPAKELEEYLGVDNQFVFIAGSIRAGEIQTVIDAISAVLKSNTNFRVALAPRHLKELNQLETAVKLAELFYIKRSDLSGQSSAIQPVLILDTMGELGGLYPFADLAFVGGSLVKIGGHDPLEPASAGCAVCFGPHMDNSRQFADMLVDSGGAVYVKNGVELANLIKMLITDTAKAKMTGDKARRAVLSHTGVSKRIALKLLEFIQ